MENETNQVVLLKDLDNCKIKKGKQNLLVPTLQKLENKFKAQWFLYENQNNFAGLFFVTEAMKTAVASYPEFLGIDATFKLLNIRAPVYLMVVEDSNGCSEVAGVCILVSEDRESINWMMDSFKKAHPNWDKIKCVMTDKDLNERDAVKEALPSANVIICAFHTLRIFNREITTDKRNITKDQRDQSKAILQQMVFAATLEEYDLLYEELQEMPETVVEYFNQNWHPIRDEWSLNNNFMHGNFLNNTNNRLESLNSKIKKACSYYNTLEDFIEKLITFFCCLNTERDHKAAYSYHKREIISLEENSPMKKYMELLTSYSFKFVNEEYNKKQFVNVDDTTPESQEFITTYQNLTRISTSISTCDCTRYAAMQLPCRHIFAVRELKKINLYDENLCLERWKKKYYFKNQRIFQTVDTEMEIPECVISSNEYKTKILSQHEKFKKASFLIKDLPSLVAERSNDLYLQRMENLRDLCDAYRNGEEVMIVRVNDSHNQSLQETHHISNSVDSSNSNNSVCCGRDNSGNGSSIIKSGDDGDNSDCDSSRSCKKYKISNNKKRISRRLSSSPASSSSIETHAVDNQDFSLLSNMSSIHTDNFDLDVENNLNFNDEKKRTSSSPVASTSSLTRTTDISSVRKKKKRLEEIIVQPAMKLRGRAKGSKQTAIGLPKKKYIKKPFHQKSDYEKSSIMLNWFVDKEIVNKALNCKYLIKEEEVETIPNRVSSAVVDQLVQIDLIKKYFTINAWKVVEQVYSSKKKSPEWECPSCKKNLDITVDVKSKYKTSICCNYCFEWYHLMCTGLTRCPRKTLWMCNECEKN